MKSRFRDPTSIFGFGLGLVVLFILTLILATRAWPAEAHEARQDDVTITGVASPECRSADESWSVEWTLAVDEHAERFRITESRPNKLTWDGNVVEPGSSTSTEVTYNASVEEAQIRVIHEHEATEGKEATRARFFSEVVQRPELCPEPTPTSTPEPTATPLPTLEPLDLCKNIEGRQTSIPDGLEWQAFQCNPPAPEPTAAPPTTGGSVITPPSTGSAGLR